MLGSEGWGIGRRNDPEQKGDILFTARQDYRDFILELEFKLGMGLSTRVFFSATPKSKYR